MEIHTTSDVSTSDKKSWRESDTFKTLEALRPWAQWFLVGVFAVGSLYMYTRDTNAEQGVSLREIERRQQALDTKIEAKSTARDREIEQLKADQVTMQLFNERTQAMQRQLDEVKTDTKEILSRLPVRNP